MKNERFKTRNATIWLGEDGIVRAVYVSGARETIDDAIEDSAMQDRAAQGEKKPILVDMSGLKNMDRGAREYFAKESAKITTAAALLVDTPVSKVLGNLLIGLNRLSHPVKLFTSEAEAIEWLKEFVKVEGT